MIDGTELDINDFIAATLIHFEYIYREFIVNFSVFIFRGGLASSTPTPPPHPPIIPPIDWPCPSFNGSGGIFPGATANQKR